MKLPFEQNSSRSLCRINSERILAVNHCTKLIFGSLLNDTDLITYQWAQTTIMFKVFFFGQQKFTIITSDNNSIEKTDL